VIEISRTAAGVCLWINLVQAQNMLALHANIYKIWPLVLFCRIFDVSDRKIYQNNILRTTLFL